MIGGISNTGKYTLLEANQQQHRTLQLDNVEGKTTIFNDNWWHERSADTTGHLGILLD